MKETASPTTSEKAEDACSSVWLGSLMGWPIAGSG